MKLLVAFLILALSAQPVAAADCDMDAGSDAGHHAAMTTMDADNPKGHDCCGGMDSEPEDSCGGALPCGFCPAGFLALVAAAPDAPTQAAHSVFPTRVEGLAPSHHSPPFRPPISVS
jgi:hypothetical protein